MNATVEKIVNLLFQDTDMTQEAQAMHDELLTNCQDRYEDLIACGKSEDDAIAGVIESLKGMEEVIASYPKKRSQHFSIDVDINMHDDEDDDDDEDERVIRIPAEGLKELVYEVRGGDLTLESCGGTDVVVRYDRDDCKDLLVRRDGDRMTVTEDRTDTHQSASSEESLVGAIRSLFSSFIHSGFDADVVISIPRDIALKLVVRCGDGDVEVGDVRLTGAELNTASGDVEFRPSMDGRMDKVSVNTASGDVDARFAADDVHIKCMSGDVKLFADCRSIDVSSISGDLRLNMDCEQIKAKTVSGDLRLSCPNRAPRDINISSTSGDVRVELPAQTQVDVQSKSVSGDVHCSLPQSYNESAVKVRAQTVSGDVDIAAAR